MIFIDTNFFLRFFLKDIENQYLETKKIFRKGARGEEELVTSIIVFFELFWVLSSTYNYKREEVSQIIHAVLQMTFIKFEERILLWEALELFDVTNLSLGDCYNVVFAKEMKVKLFKTFDIKLQKVAKALLEKETLDTAEFEKLMGLPAGREGKKVA